MCSMPSSGASSARHIVGADALGEANDEEVRGSVDVVTMRRADSRRRKAEAIQAQLEKIKPLSKAPAPVPAAALAADLAAYMPMYARYGMALAALKPPTARNRNGARERITI